MCLMMLYPMLYLKMCALGGEDDRIKDENDQEPMNPLSVHSLGALMQDCKEVVEVVQRLMLMSYHLVLNTFEYLIVVNGVQCFHG